MPPAPATVPDPLDPAAGPADPSAWPLTIASYNLNGVRSAWRRGLLEWIAERQPTVLCLQEVRADPGQVDQTALAALGYHWALWQPAAKPGYSGVALLARRPLVAAGPCLLGDHELDTEGRIIEGDLDTGLETLPTLRLWSVYLPSGTTGEARQAVKDRSLALMEGWLGARSGCPEDPLLAGAAGAHVAALPGVLCGDLNIAHTEADIHNPKSNARSPGFLPHERAWMTALLNPPAGRPAGWVDSFRQAHPGARHHYSWWSARPGCRDRNLGWRIDYALANHALTAAPVRLCGWIEPEARHSDHCPVWLGIGPR